MPFFVTMRFLCASFNVFDEKLLSSFIVAETLEKIIERTGQLSSFGD